MKFPRSTHFIALIVFIAGVTFVGITRAALPFLSSEGGFHIASLISQPPLSQDWGIFGNRDFPGVDFVGGGNGWRFTPASKDSFSGPAAILDTLGNFFLSGEATAKKIFAGAIDIGKGALTIKPSGITFGTTSFGLGADTGQKGDASIIYDTKIGQWLLRNGNGYFSAITTSATDRLGGGGGVTAHSALTGLLNDDHPQYEKNFEYNTRAANTILGVADRGKVIYATAAFTQTFTTAVTLGNGWAVIIRNDTTDGTTVLTLDPNGAETIDGLTTATMYSGDTRLILSDGANFHSQLLEGGFARFIATGASTFILPAGAEKLTVECVGAGGGGGGGRGGSSGVRDGGTGGGGGARVKLDLAASLIGVAGTSVVVTVPVGAAGGGGGTNADGSNGTAGSNTTFGTFVTGYGGGGGKGGSSAGSNTGGAGGGNGEAGANGSTVAIRGGVAVAAGVPGSGGAGGGAAISAAINNSIWSWGQPAEYGGGGGGGTTGGVAGSSGTSVWGGGGGGSGGGLTSVGGTTAGIAGGDVLTYGQGGGPAGGAGGGTNNGAGGNAGDLQKSGQGGAGGGSNNGGTGGAGGSGGAIGGGGGGGAAGNPTGGAGNSGGRGECRVWYS